MRRVLPYLIAAYGLVLGVCIFLGGHKLIEHVRPCLAPPICHIDIDC